MYNKVEIISYKHNGDLHRVWQYGYIVRETSDMLVLVNDRANVIDGDGRRWRTKEPAVCYFFKDYWFNIICMMRNHSVYYYCNLSSPYVKDEEGVKYIDYDLDVKVFPSGDKLVLDRDEFDFNKLDLKYPADLIVIIEKNLKLLLNRIDEGLAPFALGTVLNDYNLYKAQKKQMEKRLERAKD